MEWNLFRDRIGIDPADEANLKEILVRLQDSFFRLCSNTTGNGQPIIDRFASFLAAENPSQDRTSEYLVGLLREETIDGVSKMDHLAEIEGRARERLLEELSGLQRERFLRYAPESLLDIDPGYNPFAAFLESKFGEPVPAGFVCRSPYEYVHVQANGDVYPCCPSKFGKIIGNLTHQTLNEIWNSAEALEVRESIESGDYRFCNAHACEYLRKAAAGHVALSPPGLVQWLRNKRLLEAGSSPKVINLGSDKTCNLACSYCRKEMYKLTDTERQRIALIDKHAFEDLGDDTERLVLLGEGDPFASPVYLNKLRTYDWRRHKRLKIKIQTNGLLLNPAMWESIANSHDVIDWISISIDAATAGTYRINRGGDFNKLLQNLKFVAGLRATNRIGKFWINFLVQNNNYREMPDFTLLGKRLGCDLIEFQRIENWGVLTEAQYREIAVHEPWHPNNGDLLRVLRHPVLRSEGVWLLKLHETMNSSTEMNIVSWDE